jgi:predicted helicase
MSFLLEELGYKLGEDERFKLYLTNTLEMEELAQTNLPGMASLSKESHLAGKVKKEEPILVILGNPPYSGISSNKGKWIDDLLKKGYIHSDGKVDEGYYKVDGKPLGERNPKWLQDDYVKFIRFAQWKIDQIEEGVLGFITSHSYIDNPTFRGMRQSLMNTFNEIYILNLHGNSLKIEKCPDGSKDQNVFDIQQGVAIALFIKRKNNQKINNVYHSDLWGLRETKYKWLLQNDIKTTKWEKISPKSEHYFFIPRDDSFLGDYQKYFKITEIFPLNGVGITTARDHFVIDTDKKSLENRIRLFKNSKYSDDDLHTFFQINKKKGWNIRKAWNMLQSIPDSDLNKFIKPILYRPFDIRWIFYHDSVVWRTVRKVMQNMIEENLGLISTRFVFKKEMGFHHAFVTKNILDINQIQSPGTAQLFPLYLHLEKKQELFNDKYNSKDKKMNISSYIIKILTKQYKKEFIPEEIFYYIYALLYSNIYREKYTEFLKIDFPRIPFTEKYGLFREMVRFGKRLVDLHLLRSAELDLPLCKFQGQGDNRIGIIKYEETEKRIYFNEKQYFEQIPQEIWQYQIGGYQVCEKWLKDRKGRCLSLEDIKHYCRMVTALQKTIKIQKEIDNIYEEVEKDLIKI